MTKDNGANTIHGLLYGVKNHALLHWNMNVQISKPFMPMLSRVKVGRLKEKPPGPGAKSANINILKLILKETDGPHYDNAIYYLLITFLWTTIRRCGEATTNSITFKHFLFNNTTPHYFDSASWVKVTITKSKTNQIGKTQYATFHCTCKTWGVCCFCAFIRIRSYTTRAPLDAPVFIERDGTPITLARLNTKLKALCKKLDIAVLSTHSFRKGGALHHIKTKTPFHIIMAQAGWKSIKTLFHYLSSQEPYERMNELQKAQNIAKQHNHIFIDR